MDIILDVREKDEFLAGHVPGAILCPLTDIRTTFPGIEKNLRSGNVKIMCRSGNRARHALEEIRQLSQEPQRYSVYEGGMLAWEKNGGRSQVGGKASIPIMRQFQLVLSIFLLVLSALTLLVDPLFIYGVLAIGMALGIAGVTGTCPMLILLNKLPWNRSASCALNR